MTPFLRRAVYAGASTVLGLFSHWPEPAGTRRLDAHHATTKGGLHVLTFVRDDEGQGLVEYALIIAVIAIAVIVAMVFLRGQIQNIFSNIGNNLT